MLKPLKTDFRPLDKWLTFTLLLGPVASLTNLTVSYALVPEACERGTKLALHLSALVCFAACLGGALLAWRIAMSFVPQGPVPDRMIERTRWLAIAGVVLCVFSALVIVAMEIPNVILRSCD
jgi:hypothetical protein